MTNITRCECGVIFKMDMEYIIKVDGIVYAKPVRIVHIDATKFEVYGVEVVCPVCGKVLGSKFKDGGDKNEQVSKRYRIYPIC